MSPDIIQWWLTNLWRPPIESTEGYVNPAGPWYGRPASEIAFLDPLNPIDFTQSPYSGYAGGGGAAADALPSVAMPSSPGTAADALPPSMGSGTVFPWETA